MYPIPSIITEHFNEYPLTFTRVFPLALRLNLSSRVGLGNADRRGQVDVEERRQRRHQRALGRGLFAIMAIVTVVGLPGFLVTSALRIVPRSLSSGMRGSVMNLPVICDVVIFLIMGRDDGSDFNRDVTTVASTKSTSEERTTNPWAQDVRKVELDRSVGPFLELLPGVDEILDTGRVNVGNSREVENEGTKEWF